MAGAGSCLLHLTPVRHYLVTAWGAPTPTSVPCTAGPIPNTTRSAARPDCSRVVTISPTQPDASVAPGRASRSVRTALVLVSHRSRRLLLSDLRSELPPTSCAT